MADEKSTNGTSEKVSIVEGLATIPEENLTGSLTEQENMQFDKARFAQEQADNSSFVLGGQIRRRF